MASEPHFRSCSFALPLLNARSGFAFVRGNSVHHHLVSVRGGVACIALAPVIADSVGEDVSLGIEGGC